RARAAPGSRRAGPGAAAARPPPRVRRAARHPRPRRRRPCAPRRCPRAAWAGAPVSPPLTSHHGPPTSGRPSTGGGGSADGAAQLLDPVGALPGEGGQLPAEVAVGAGVPVDRTQEVERVDDRGG